jgi:hypothetical protein
VALRNELVHSEPRSFSLDRLDDPADFRDDLSERLRERVSDSVETLLRILQDYGYTAWQFRYLHSPYSMVRESLREPVAVCVPYALTAAFSNLQ